MQRQSGLEGKLTHGGDVLIQRHSSKRWWPQSSHEVQPRGEVRESREVGGDRGVTGSLRCHVVFDVAKTHRVSTDLRAALYLCQQTQLLLLFRCPR